MSVHARTILFFALACCFLICAVLAVLGGATFAGLTLAAVAVGNFTLAARQARGTAR